MSRRPDRARAYAPDPAAPGRCCDLPGCGAPGEYRAPKSRLNLREYWWFCLEHVRAYNSTWDYYKGMSPVEMERELRADTAWQRPSWPLGRLGPATWDDDEVRGNRLRWGALGWILTLQFFVVETVAQAYQSVYSRTDNVSTWSPARTRP